MEVGLNLACTLVVRLDLAACDCVEEGGDQRGVSARPDPRSGGRSRARGSLWLVGRQRCGQGGAGVVIAQRERDREETGETRVGGRVFSFEPFFHLPVALVGK